ncbi:hypothetical protein BC939DRAFT_433949 [Gamsiella multidivaricata]|uniref:uncharacterized protein n=1 Tax=Gamsiella multidivaricata TaxID=101098 RepID=UPI00222039A0|nr:uncharacterized protein BC939DRAFT_433949 [Gamsiella multidivaricata]KAI7832638.1 hypothetical protein BC939DRAFT_433949 [Gamsiella multidivaricata]
MTLFFFFGVVILLLGRRLVSTTYAALSQSRIEATRTKARRELYTNNKDDRSTPQQKKGMQRVMTSLDHFGQKGQNTLY